MTTFAEGAIIGILNWDGGSLSGSLTIPTNGVLNIVPGGGNALSGLVLTNYGMVNWSNTTLYGDAPNNAQIYNYGTWNALSGSQFQGGYGGGTTLFENFGTFAVSAGTNATSLDGNVIFDNWGTVDIASGALNVNAGASSGGNVITSAAGEINFNNYLFTNANTFAGTGSYVVGSVTFAGTISGILNWVSGNLSGVLTIPASGVLNILPGGGNGFVGLLLTNYGTVNWTNTTIYSRASGNAKIYNYGTWNALSGSQFQGGYGGGGTTLR